MKAALALACLPLLAGCIAAVPIPLTGSGRSDAPTVASGKTIGTSAVSGPWDNISYEVSSWGRPLSAWNIRPDGSGEWSEGVPAAGAPRDENRLISYELTADPAAVARLRQAVEALPFPAPASQPCKDFITDQPYGRLRLEKGANVLEISFNGGCRDQPYRDFLTRLQAVDSLVAERGRTTSAVR